MVGTLMLGVFILAHVVVLVVVCSVVVLAIPSPPLPSPRLLPVFMALVRVPPAGSSLPAALAFLAFSPPPTRFRVLFRRDLQRPILHLRSMFISTLQMRCTKTSKLKV